MEMYEWTIRLWRERESLGGVNERFLERGQRERNKEASTGNYKSCYTMDKGSLYKSDHCFKLCIFNIIIVNY